MQSEPYKGLIVNYDEGSNFLYLNKKADIEKITTAFEYNAKQYDYHGKYVVPLAYNDTNVLTLLLNDKEVSLGVFDAKSQTITRKCHLEDIIHITSKSVSVMSCRSENITKRGLTMDSREPALKAWVKEIERTRDPISMHDEKIVKEFNAVYTEFQIMKNRINSPEVSRGDMEL